MEIIWKVIFVMLLLIIALIVAHFMDKSKEKAVRDRMSFRETMDLTGLPIVTFKQGDKKFNFILDTGAYSSIIDSRILDNIEYTPLADTAVGYGIDGKKYTMETVGINLTYKDKQYSDAFRVLDMTASFDSFKKDFGVNVHGLLSSSFFERYKYVLNYEELVAYSMV